MKPITLAASTLLLFCASAAWAVDPSTTTTAKPKSPESLECSRQADAKGLHGQARKEFRAKCKKELKAKAAPKNP
jgi:hypothetical protein